jgi:RNA recognition motif-containing protein
MKPINTIAKKRTPSLVEKMVKVKKTGVLFLKNILPNTNVSKLLNYLKKFGDIKRTFFCNNHNLESCYDKKKHTKIVGFVEYNRKISAKRASILMSNLLYNRQTKLLFRKALYLKSTDWKEITTFFE